MPSSGLATIENIDDLHRIEETTLVWEYRKPSIQRQHFSDDEIVKFLIFILRTEHIFTWDKCICRLESSRVEAKMFSLISLKWPPNI